MQIQIKRVSTGIRKFPKNLMQIQVKRVSTGIRKFPRNLMQRDLKCRRLAVTEKIERIGLSTLYSNCKKHQIISIMMMKMMMIMIMHILENDEAAFSQKFKFR